MNSQDSTVMADLQAIRANYSLTSEQRQIVDHVDRVSREVLHPLQARMDAEDWWPDDLFKQMGELGLLGITAPEEMGGSGQNEFTQALVSEVISKWNPAVGLSHGAHDNLCLNNLLRNGSEEQVKKYVPGLCSGDLVGALGLTEPGAGSDALGSMATTARRDGEDYIINGSKIYITNGPIADVVLLYAKTDKSKGAKGISAFIIETDNPGFKVAQKLDKMGFRGSPTGELVFDECRVPASAMVGAENSGVSVVMSGLDLERAMVTSVCVGMAERALELGLEYAKIREQFGKPIASFQMVQSKLAEIYTEVETARAFSYRALAACVGLPKGAGGRGEIHKLTAAACLYAGEAFNKAVTEACHIHGGSGYMQDTEINRLFRANKLLEIGAGTSEVRKIIIAEELLRA
ncbi:acyl-CoA dehydrogenase family protein [Sulfitobacter pseudonitzschiae]|jgi:isovaleryl-CoA dehydrogenase|uniref:Cyclohexane-1-carbonyl-CoA dehydrogenase n=1 Tax=Pseudosulfitobacter pseudonitzschiae TaxID=1402135 RepID=A0A073IXK1_9RHOB|nr:acyl-CoA dehydrogenase family protein [Pseudosulfitobacter pseudonitzschiae]KEJ94350.1 isovaleryl-CoA dehydrogenase [Pseudosulfitobacter pseudonitzschiae]MBM1816851.1 acyl-CoA dehydrogenase family protein [Pseudosulfitobacter pseudonitzschiae]MBM1833864.1 acyl-CoA dehydrogenase family protein [Pseudosulfitobacter pseudonitzschiae]MBM1838730.1 acyl-CoA dehydrogenase family protein [Pseudosulfitobacter pseudonitzschiae]MBM1843579.1 acyl-CoA dehydrogenase family protein [Pseudosulfitobacter ps|tara:strand:+ start:269 stop:1483 length:1215 start_codon:yes stop_codon:yes gene_type:complete